MKNFIFKKRRHGFFLLTTAVICCSFILSCAHYINTSVTVTPGFSRYRKVALLWQNGKSNIHENLFLTNWMNSFPNQTVIERKEISKIIREQDLLPGRLNDRTRARMREILGVDALILVIFYSEYRGFLAPRRIVDLSIKVVDAETGVITVSAVSQGKDRSIDSKIIEAVKIIESKTKAIP
jgi:hypothetical protein